MTNVHQLLEKAILGYTVNAARKALWRVTPDYDMDDLLQEGALIHCIIRARYPEAKDPAHIMALFKRAYGNRLQDLARERTLRWENRAEADLTVSEAPAQIEAALGQLSAMSGALVKSMMSDPAAYISKRTETGERETTTEAWARAFGMTGVNLRARLRSELA